MRSVNYNCMQVIAVGVGRRLFGCKLLLQVPCISTTIIILAVMVGCSCGPSAACADRIYTSSRAAAAHDKMHDVAATYHEQQVEHNLCEDLLCSSKLSTELRKTTMAETEAELRASLNRAAEKLLLTSTTPIEETSSTSATATTAQRVLHEVPSGPNPISNSLPGT
ncbi:hypothetical protein L7F22_061966 [Adiantum nelumboides]|nr:hypothetical protein [Adiantum nelumboides]